MERKRQIERDKEKKENEQIKVWREKKYNGRKDINGERRQEIRREREREKRKERGKRKRETERQREREKEGKEKTVTRERYKKSKR
jgi:hypothetical protein